MDRLDGVTKGGRLDLDVVRGIRAPISRADSAFADAAADLDGVDSSGLVGPLATQFNDYREQIDSAADGLSSGRTAVDLLPAMAGGDGPRDYLFVFQNNAEIRATGGLPGSWARIHAEDGDLSIREQGAWPDFPQTEDPIIPVTPAEQAVYTRGFATNFASAGSTPDFPRVATIWRGFWDRKFPDTPIDGVIAIDPVALSYLLAGTGPVQVGDVTLTSDNVVEQVLNAPYLRLTEPSAQDAFFQDTARSVFDAITGDLMSPVSFVEGLARAGREQRFLVAPFEEGEAARLDGTPVAGALDVADPTIAQVDIGVNDATGSKMSYYLRYDAGARRRPPAATAGSSLRDG